MSDDPQPLRLTFGARPNDADEWADRIGAILAEIARRNIWANRTAVYDPAWDWRRSQAR